MISRLLDQIRNITKKNKTYIILGAIFALSLVIRWGFITHTDPFNLDWTQSATLIHLDTMGQYNSLKNIIGPTLTYPVGANRFIDSNSTNEPGLQGFMNKEGEYFYMSYPPFAFLFPYMLFGILHIPAHIISLRILSIFIHLLSAFLIYKLMYEMTKKESISIFAFASYIFLPIAFQWHTWIYFSDIAVHPLFIFGLYLLYKIFEQKTDSKYFILYSINLFFMCYTDWIGFIFAGISLIALVLCAHRKNLKKIIFAHIWIPILTFIIIISQYSYAIGGFKVFFSILWGKYIHGYARGGASSHLTEKFLTIESHYSAILPIVLLFTVLFLIYIFDQHKDNAFKTPVKEILLISFFTVLVHHIVFFQWTSHSYHYFSVLKSMIWVTLFISYMTHLYLKHPYFSKNKVVKILFIILFAYAYSKSFYWYTKGVPNVPDEYYSSYCKTAEEMGQIAEPDEVIFVKDSAKPVHAYPLSTVFPYCSKRNIAIYYSAEQARDLLKKNNTNRGIIFTLKYSGPSINGFVDILEIEKINYKYKE